MSLAVEAAQRGAAARLGIKVLGTDDLGMLNFLDQNGRLQKCPARSVSKSFLMSLAPLESWEQDYKEKTKVEWDRAASDMIFLASKDFDYRRTKGLGAWRDKSGKICFHTGNPSQIIGEAPKDWVFIRKSNRDIGLNAKPTCLQDRTDILDTVKQLSFESWQDGVRVLSWATLAPFSGALPWRSSGLITGRSGSGKSQVVDLIVKPLVGDLVIFASGSSTEPGIRQKTAVDALPVIIEEFEADTVNDKTNRDALLRLMRQSTSDDTPSIFKGGKDGESQAFSLKCMFLFIGISPIVDREADENRLFFCNVKNPPEGGDPNWPRNRDTLNRLMTKESADGIRALTWQKLPKIIENINKLIKIIQDETELNSRQATAEAPLFAAYMVIWLGIESPTVTQVKQLVREFYKGHKVERRDETDDMLDKLLSHIVTIHESKEKYSLRELLYMVEYNTNILDEDAEDIEKVQGSLTGEQKKLYKRTLGHYGLSTAPMGTGAVGVAKNNHEIMKILQVGRGYHKQLFRHDRCIEKSKNISVSGKPVNHLIIDRVLTK